MNLYFRHISISVTSTLLILLILYSILKITNVDMNEFKRVDGMKRMYQSNPILVFIVIAIVIIGAYSIYKSILSQLNYMFYERYESVSLKNERVLMNFDSFYTTFMMNNPNDQKDVTDTEHEVVHELEHELEYDVEHEVENVHDIDHDDKNKNTQNTTSKPTMIFRTDIGGIKYYLVMDSKDKENIPFRRTNSFQPKEEADMPIVCETNGNLSKCVYPVLLREDLLDTEYKNYINAILKAKNNNEIYPQSMRLEKESNPSSLYPQSMRLEKESNPSSLYPQSVRLEKESNPSSLYPQSVRLEKEGKAFFLFPRYIHHINVNRRPGQTINQNMYQTVGINPDALPLSTPKVVSVNNIPGYQISGLIREQTNDVSKVNSEPTYQMDLLKSRSPLTALRKTKRITMGKNEKGEPKTIMQMFDSVNDRKFVCGSQNMASTKYSDIHFITIPIDNSTPATTSNSVTDAKRVSDEFIYNGNNNTDITFLDPKVNMMLKLDIKDEKNVMHKDTKFFIARLDTYEDPLLIKDPGVVSTDLYYNKDSPYYRKPAIYPVGIIPEDYKECSTDKNGNIDSYCRGNKYIDGIDYSDARKIDFEVAIVRIRPIV